MSPGDAVEVQKNVRILTPEGVEDTGSITFSRHGIIAVQGDRSSKNGAATSGTLMTAGLIDLQLNGAFGFDFTADPGAIWEVARRLPSFGVTAFLPTIVSSSEETTERAIDVVSAGPPAGFRGANVLGLHFEGPHLNVKASGAHNPLTIRPIQDHPRWCRNHGVRLVTLAPELPGAGAWTRELCARGVVAAAGHTLATYDEALRGFEAGISYVTHLMNAMSPLHHREPGIAGAALLDPRIVTGLIPDGVHIHPAVMRLIQEIKGADGLSLVSDSMAAAAMPAGRYQLGEFEVHVDHVAARLSNGTLAGSILTLDEAVRRFARLTQSEFTRAILAATAVPARILGEDRGRVRVGQVADLVLWDKDHQVLKVWIGGELVFERGALHGTP